MVDVAQLVEHRIVAPAVEGSIPFVHPKFMGTVVLGDRAFLAVWDLRLFGKFRLKANELFCLPSEQFGKTAARRLSATG